MNIADLKKRKKALKLSVKELSMLADLPNSTVSKIFTGETKNPSYLTVERIEATIVQEEARQRAMKYLEALHRYMESHASEEDFDIEAFDRAYREEHHLNDAPIPFARDRDGEPLTIGNLAVSPDGLMTIDEYMALGEDIKFPKYELLDGHLIINDIALFSHQDVVQELGRAIDRYIFSNNGSCRMYNVGLNNRFPGDNYTWLIPDLVVICNRDIIDRTGLMGAPDWVVEVTSPSTRSYDYNGKKNKYMNCGVREYWIIDLQKEKIMVYLGEDPDTAHIYNFEDEVPVSIYNGDLKIRISDLLNY